MDNPRFGYDRKNTVIVEYINKYSHGTILLLNYFENLKIKGKFLLNIKYVFHHEALVQNALLSDKYLASYALKTLSYLRAIEMKM
jgi:hypothetical protein